MQANADALQQQYLAPIVAPEQLDERPAHLRLPPPAADDFDRYHRGAVASPSLCLCAVTEPPNTRSMSVATDLAEAR